MTNASFWSYVSTKAGADPVRTIFLCVPDGDARDLESVATFARESGWLDVAEEDGSLVVAPVAPDGWAAAPHDLLRDLYLAHRNDFRAPSGTSIPGCDGIVWTWESLICLVGYGEGAVHAANLAVSHPSFAASVVLVDGAADDFANVDEPSDHWFVAHPSVSWHASRREVPLACWLAGSAATDSRMVSYLTTQGGPGWRVCLAPELKGSDPVIARRAMEDFVSHVVRWKSSPDGMLAWHLSKREFWEGETYRHAWTEVGGIRYHHATYVPANLVDKPAVVLSLHGRGEPSWIFSEKNGWERLADETGEFVVVLPDSPGNVWSASRDANALEEIVREVVTRYGADPSRVYVTGFSNGAAFTWQQSTSRPWLFAAASPWNCPPAEAIASGGLGDYLASPDFSTSGYDMPLFVIAGDVDVKAPADSDRDLLAALAPNGCDAGGEGTWDASERYAASRGYVDGRRLSTRTFADAEGVVRVCFTTVRDMPHGAYEDEARATWEFMRVFSRPSRSCRSVAASEDLARGKDER